MLRRPSSARLLAIALSVLALASAVSSLHADSNGRTGRALSATGCNCHGTVNTPSVTVTITGPQAVKPSTTNSYTVTVTGGPTAPDGGFDLNASGGTLLAGLNNRVSGSDVTHSGSGVRTWTFRWTAPATNGTVNFAAIGLAADGSGDTGGDQWNWYGGAVGTLFPILVSDALDVPPPGARTWLAPPAPNPLVTAARVSFSLAAAGEATLEAFDAAGRRVATLARGRFEAGPRSVTWNGADDRGVPLRGGLYFLRLRTADRVLATRALVQR